MRVLMVAEKPSIAQAVANALCCGAPVNKRKGISPSAPVFEYDGSFMGTAASFRVTSTVGHMWSLDFGREFNDQGKVQPIELFEAPTFDIPKKSEPAASFECGVCGGAAGGCPNCGGGYSASLVTAAANPGFECGACGGAAGGCPNCGGYSA